MLIAKQQQQNFFFIGDFSIKQKKRKQKRSINYQSTTIKKFRFMRCEYQNNNKIFVVDDFNFLVKEKNLHDFDFFSLSK